MNYVPVSTPFNIFLDFEVSPLFKRIVAWGIDILLLILFSYAVRYILAMFSYKDGYSAGWDLLLVSLPMLMYALFMEIYFQGQSLGKMAMNLRVISLEGGEPGLGQYLMRWIFRIWEWPIVFGSIGFDFLNLFVQIVLVLFIGIVVLIVVAVSSKGQRLGDLAAGTSVVNLNQRFNVNDTVFQEVTPHNYQVLFPEVMRLSDRDINAIKSVIISTHKRGKYDTALRIADKVKEVLQITNHGDVLEFLEKLLADYNYLATRE